MRRKEKPRSLLTSLTAFPKTFSYDVDAPIETVVHRLAELDQDAALFRRGSQEISVLPMQDHYVFRIRRRRHGTLTSSAEGQISQDETGCVIVEGESRINGVAPIVSLIVISLIGLLVVLAAMPAASQPIMIVPFTLSMLIGLIPSVMMYRHDRQTMMNQLTQVIEDINAHSQTKEKRYPALEIQEEDIDYDEDDVHSQAQEKRR